MTTRKPPPLLFVIFVLILVSCSQSAPEVESPTDLPLMTASPDEQVQVTEMVEEPTATPTDPPATPTEMLTEEPESEQEADESQKLANACLDCHSDKQALIDTAKPEEEVVVENEGEG